MPHAANGLVLNASDVGHDLLCDRVGAHHMGIVVGPRQPLDCCRQLRQAGRRVSTRSFDTRSKASIDLAALAIKLAVGASPHDQLDGHGAESGSGSFFALGPRTSQGENATSQWWR